MREHNCLQEESALCESPGDSPKTWHSLADRVLAGHSLSRDECISILHASNDDLLDLLAAAYRVRRKWFGHQVNLNFLINAKSGNCSENCRYCSQSRVSLAAIATHRMLPYEDILAGVVP
jgi:biotin synthase